VIVLDLNGNLGKIFHSMLSMKLFGGKTIYIWISFLQKFAKKFYQFVLKTSFGMVELCRTWKVYTIILKKVEQ